MRKQVTWTNKKRGQFTDWIQHELTQCLSDRGVLESHWVNLIAQHRAKVVGDGTSDVPFIGASDLEFPLTSMHFEPVYADLIQTLHFPRDFWTIQALRSDTVETAKPLQEFLSVVERTVLKMREVNKRAFIDLILLGTTVYKDYIHHSRHTRLEYVDSGDETKEVTKIEFGPRVEHVGLQNFFIPAYSYKIDPDEVGGAPWVAHRFELTKDQFKARAEGQSPFLPNYDPEAVKRVLANEEEVSGEDKVKREIQRLDRTIPFRDSKIRLFEVWARFEGEDVVAVWHHRSGTLLRIVYNPFLHGHRPFHSSNYMPGFGFYGTGLGEADEWSQLALTRMLNNLINNATLANTRMYGVPMGANISPDEPIMAGKIWPLGPNEQIGEITMSDIHPSMFQMMSGMMQWSEQRTAVSELRQGNISTLPDRTPASSMLSMLQESGKKFDMMLANLRSGALDRIGEHVLQNLVQISRTDPRWMALAAQVLGPQKAGEVSKILTGPIHDIREKYGITVTATSSQVNKEVERQSLMGLAQIAMQTYPVLIQYAQAQQNPQLLQATMSSAYSAQLELFRRILEAFDIKNTDLFIPEGMTDAAGPGAGMLETPPLGGPAGPGVFAQGQDPISQILGIGG